MHHHDDGVIDDTDVNSGGSSRACARSEVVAFARYCTFIDFGIQRWLVGTVVIEQRTIWARRPPHTRAPSGPHSAPIDAKYGTRTIAAAENNRVPPGCEARRFDMRYVVVGAAMPGYLTLE